MKLEESVEIIRTLIFKAFDKRLSQLGLLGSKEYPPDTLPPESKPERKRIDDILSNLTGETGNYENARKKLIDELSFTLFNRIAGVKVMEVHQIIPDVFTRRESHGGRSFGHKLWLEQHPEKVSLKLEGLNEYVRHAFDELSLRIHLYSADYLYDMLPDLFDLNDIISEFNNIDEQQWQSDDILGWLYESYNQSAKKEFKVSGAKIEYDKVALTSQVYTPRWVVEFILNNSLGKLWMEMHPDSTLKNNHDIANIPDQPTIKAKPVTDIKVLDPAPGSGNFLLYAFDLLYEMYLEGDYDEQEIPRLIIENNLFGIDIDDRAVQIAQLGLYIKALKKNNNITINKMNVVSADFYLSEYESVKNVFDELTLNTDAEDLLKTIWNDLRQAHKFGSLIRIEEKVAAVAQKYKDPGQASLWDASQVKFWDNWSENVIQRIKKTIEEYTFSSNGNVKFFKTKTLDSITFVEILINKFDVVVTNPPYTDSANYGKGLKKFVETNYKKPTSFNTNIFSTFLKRASELILGEAKIGIVHPPTFMYIKTFEDMRHFILEYYHIHLFVEWGYLGMFNPKARVDSAIYILESKSKTSLSIFIKLNELYETMRKKALFEAFSSYLKKRQNVNLYLIDQSKLKLIKSYPFIYWISDAFRKKFSGHLVNNLFYVCQGLSISNKERFSRFWWEIEIDKISKDYSDDNKKWVAFSKGGPFNKWYGNLWLVINWENNGKELKDYKNAVIRNEEFYFLEGITYTSSGSKGTSFRYLPNNHIISGGGPAIYLKRNDFDLFYSLAFMNSNLASYIIDCLNPTVNTTQGDLKRIPFISPENDIEKKISGIAKKNVEMKNLLCTFSIIEKNYKQNPIAWIKEKHDKYDPKSLIKAFLEYENILLTRVSINEAVIDELIFEVYDLSEDDKKMVLDKEGIPIGNFEFVDDYQKFHDQPADFVKEFVNNLPIKKQNEKEKQALKNQIEGLYENNYSLEEICKEVKINPISVTNILKESPVISSKRMNEIASDFIVDVVREILNEDDDGIVPLVDFAGESSLQKRVYDKLIEKGFTTAQISNYSEILGREIYTFIEQYFFRYLSDRLNLFMYLPKTPFIWHLSSGDHGGFEAFIIIYKWSRDKLLRVRSVYVEKRQSSLKNRLLDLAGDSSVKAQNEKEIIQKQLAEIDKFKTALDDILKSKYAPKLDDGVGKNIAPLQEKGLLKVDVLKEKELQKYLNADW